MIEEEITTISNETLMLKEMKETIIKISREIQILNSCK